ncbi:DUF4349 domain-containing protein [Chryseobacterium sp.]|uniref:DUF4349 domain-containing protein n=1 Tax=Chryseobacterium sp. TaxID=1871047 RepID=UPI00389038BC
MKKYIVLIAVASSLIMCKKGEATSSEFKDLVSSADSVIANSSSTVNDMSNEANAILDSASIKIKDYQKTGIAIKEEIEKTGKNLDSLSQEFAKAKINSNNDDKDTLVHKDKQVVVNVAAPKVIKETKVIYQDREATKKREVIAQVDKMRKSGVVELNVEDAEMAKEIVLDQVKKYDGFIKSENTSTNNNDKQISYLKVKVPIQKFDYLMEDLSNQIGVVQNKGIDIFGEYYDKNTLCDIEVTLSSVGNNAVVLDDKDFGSRSFAALSSGWNVITSIFLFLLPMWPLYLIVGIAYYFYKKKNVKNT